MMRVRNEDDSHDDNGNADEVFLALSLFPALVAKINATRHWFSNHSSESPLFSSSSLVNHKLWCISRRECLLFLQQNEQNDMIRVLRMRGHTQEMQGNSMWMKWGSREPRKKLSHIFWMQYKQTAYTVHTLSVCLTFLWIWWWWSLFPKVKCCLIPEES